MKKRNWYSSPWTIGITTSIIGSLLIYLFDKKILSAIADSIIGIWNFIVSLLNYDLKVWWLIGFAIIILIIYLIHTFRTEEIPEPEFTKYKEDRLKNWRWTWDWQWSDRKKSWIIVNLHAYCPKCGATLLDNSSLFDSIYECPQGDFKTGRLDHQAEDKRHIEALIIDKTKREI